jgi:hypothetical protein
VKGHGGVPLTTDRNRLILHRDAPLPDGDQVAALLIDTGSNGALHWRVRSCAAIG